jgi:hypothetical protein
MPGKYRHVERFGTMTKVRTSGNETEFRMTIMAMVAGACSLFSSTVKREKAEQHEYS